MSAEADTFDLHATTPMSPDVFHRVEPVLDLLLTEIQSAAEKHGLDFASAHEAHSVLEEEFDEFWDECKRKREARDADRMIAELVQVAAVAVKFAAQLLAREDVR